MTTPGRAVKRPVSVSLTDELKAWVDEEVQNSEGEFSNRSHYICRLVELERAKKNPARMSGVRAKTSTPSPRPDRPEDIKEAREMVKGAQQYASQQHSKPKHGKR